MTVDITQDEMNILNLNGISADDVRGNIEFQRASGLNDDAIRQQFTSTINELRPMTKQSATDTAKIQEWKNKGAITPFEAAKRSSTTFDGKYVNIDNTANLNLSPEQREKRAEYLDKQKQIADEYEIKQQQEKEKRHQEFLNRLYTPENIARNERVNNGTASILDRIGAFLDRQAEISERINYNSKDNVNYVAIDPVARMAGIDKDGNIKSNVDKSKPIGFAESMLENGYMNGSMIPFIGGFLKGADDKKQREIQEHILKGEPIRQDELQFLNHRLEKQQEEQVRGYTLGGNVAQGFLPSLIRFGTEMATGGYILKSLGVLPELAEGATVGQKITHGLSEMGKIGLANTLLPTGWNDTFETYQGRMLNNEMKFTDKGEWIFKDSDEKPATAFMKSLMQTFIMFASEASGQLLHIPVEGATAAMSKYVGTPISKYVMSNKTLSEFVKKAAPEFSKLYEKLNNLPIKGQNLDWLKSKVKFDGFFEELGEEVVEDVLNLTMGTNNEERTLENYAKAIFKSPDEWAILAGAIALQGGTLSVASHIIGSHLERNGANDEQISEVLTNLSENDKEKSVEDLIQDNVLNIDETDEEHFEKSVQIATENLLQKGRFTNRERAEKAVRLGSSMLENISQKTGISLDDLIRDEMAEIEQNDEEYFVDENNVLHTGIQYNENKPELTIDNQIEQWADELAELPDDFDDEEYINKLVDKITVLESIRTNELSIDELEKANDLIAEYEELGETKFAEVLKNSLNNATNPDVKPVQYNQKVNLAGATPAEYRDAIKEWKEKGTESQYFKNWFGDSQVVDDNGKPLVVYHGTDVWFEEFETGQTSYDYGFPEGIFFSDNPDVAQTYIDADNVPIECYIRLENPIVLDANGRTYNEFYDELYSNIRGAKENGHDGVIMKNIRDAYSQDGDGGDIGTTYMIFDNKQVKATDNQGTFDSENPNIYLQKENESKNLLMTHSANIESLDNILDSESLIAPSMAITNKDQKTLDDFGFGDVVFIRKPDRIDFKKDNIYDRDIYSPRMPRPQYKTNNGYNSVVDSYEYESMQRQWENDPEKFKQRYYGMTFDEFFKDAKKVLFKGYTPSGTRKYVPYNADNIIKEMKKLGLQNGEMWGYGLNSFLAQLAKKQKNMKQLKKTSIELGKVENEVIQELKDQYSNFEDDLRNYAKDEYKSYRYFSDIYPEILKAIANNNSATLNQYMDMQSLQEKDSELLKDVKDFLATAMTTKRTYFEAKPMREVMIDEFSDVLVPENSITDEQRKRFERYGITVSEYKRGEISNAIDKIAEKKPTIYFQSAYHGTPHKFDEFSLDAIGTGEGAQAHGWGLYFAGNKQISENYRKALSEGKSEWMYDGKPVSAYVKGVDIGLYKRAKQIGKEELLKGLNNRLQEAIKKVENDKQHQKEMFDIFGDYAIDLNKIKVDEIKRQIEIVKNIDESKIEYKEVKGQLFEVDIPENKYLLDEQKTFVKQTKTVQKAIKNISKTYFDIDDYDIDEMTGEDIYGEIVNNIAMRDGGKNSQSEYERLASKLLNNNGIKGITYDGAQDGRCYVVFDDKAVKVLKTYYQKQKQQRAKQHKLFIDNEKAEQISNRLEKVRGAFIPAENLIRLFKDADESTIVHEFAHWWLEKLQKYAEENEEIRQDLNEIRKFVRNNGEAFTEEQHEKFARGFETYMRTGSAKTNRLKKLFEDFKNALLSLYDSIKDLGFKDDEVAEINNLFDRLLTTENQRIQSAVFNKVNEIQSQIESIKDKQESELNDIDEIYNNNLEQNAQDSKMKAQVQEYLRLADKATDRVPQAVKDYSKRYRQVCYEILSAALGDKYSIKQIQMVLGQQNKRGENLREQLLEVADAITTSGGMRANWLEFFGDTGVNYDTDEIDGDYKLVEQALRAIENDSFLPPEQYEGEKEIGKFFGMFDYLANKVLTLRGENKDAAYEALTSIFNKIPSMPDGAMEDIARKLEEVSNSFIEQKTKENLSGRNKAIRNVSLAVQLRTYVTNKLHEMKSYDPVEKKYVRLSSVNRLYSLLKDATNVSTTKEIIRQINSHAIAQLENRQKSILHKEIQKQIKTNSKLIKVGALKQGKFDWRTNTVFHELADMNRLTIEDAQKEYLKLTQADKVELGESRDSYDENPTTTLDAPTDFQQILKTKFLEYKSNKVRNLNVAATRSLLEDILELKFEGRRAKNEEDLKKALSRYNYENDLISIILKNSDNEKAKFVARWVAGDTPFTSEGTLANWESLLNAVFNKESAKEYSLLKLESDAEVYAHRVLAKFYNKAIDIYGLRKAKSNIRSAFDKIIDFENIQPLVDLFQKYEKETYNYKQYTWNKDTNKVVGTNAELTHAQLITLYTWSFNPELKKRLIEQFGGSDVEAIGTNMSLGEYTLNDMFSKLSDEDKNFAWLLVDTCDSMYNDTNEVFIRTTGLSLQRVDNYFPSKTERVGSDIDMLHEFVVRSTNPSFIKSRKSCSRIKMDAQSPLEILLPHVNKTARYVVLSERVNFLNRIFASNDIQATLIDVYGKKSGKKIHQIILNQLATSTYANYAKSVTVGKNLMDKVASNYITSRIGGNLKVMLSQLTSVINYTENMPADVWGKGFAESLKHPKQTIKYMFDNCEYLRARLAGNSMNEIMTKLTDETDNLRTLRNFCTTNTKYGDIAAICLGGKPYVDYLIDSGMTKGEAFTKFVEDTLRSQQSGHNSATSAWQKKMAETPFTRMIFAFNNTNLQYERKWVDAVSQYVKGERSKKEFAKAFLIYKVFNPVLFTSFLTNLSILSLVRSLVGGGDDDDLFGFGKDVSMSILLSNLKAYGTLGLLANALGSIVFASLSKDRYLSQDLPLVTDFEETAQKLFTKDDLTFGDYIQMMASVGDYTTGVPATRMGNIIGGFGDFVQGDFGVGALRMVGYGKYKANMAATGHPPKKNK